MSLKLHIDSLIAQGAEFQIGIRGTGQPVGPGKVEKVTAAAVDGETAGTADLRTPSEQLYRMLVPAQMQQDKNSRPRNVILPLVFDVSDVVLVIEAPRDVSAPSVVAPISGGRTPGGLHIPGA